MIENLNSFQTITRKEINSLRNKIGSIEELVERLSSSLEHSISMTTTNTAIPEIKKFEDDNWNKIQSFLNMGNYNNAYNFALTRGNSFMLVKLIGKTGIVLDKLKDNIIENVLEKIAELISVGEFIELLLGWIIAVIDRKFNISNKVKDSLGNAMTILCEDDEMMGRLDEMQLSEANRVLNILKIENDKD